LKNSLLHIVIRVFVISVAVTLALGGIFSMVIKGANILCNVIDIDLSTSFLSNKEWFNFFATSFGGVMAGIAIYMAYKQNEKTQLEVKVQYVKQIVVTRIEKEIQSLLDLIGEFIFSSLHINNKYFSEAREPEERIDEVHNDLHDIYLKIEKCFNGVFMTSIPQNTCINVNNCGIVSGSEKILIDAQFQLLNKFREIYNCLHEYINFELGLLTNLKAQTFTKSQMKDEIIISDKILYEDVLNRLTELQAKFEEDTKISDEFIEKINGGIMELRKLSANYLSASEIFKTIFLTTNVQICRDQANCEMRKIYSRENIEELKNK